MEPRSCFTTYKHSSASFYETGIAEKVATL